MNNDNDNEICIAWPNCRAGFATDYILFIISNCGEFKSDTKTEKLYYLDSWFGKTYGIEILNSQQLLTFLN